MDANGKYTNSAPCLNCFEVINELNLKKIVYSIDGNDFHMCKPCEYTVRHVSVGNRLLQEKKLFQDITNKTRKK